MADLAKDLGLAKSTVSRALRGSRRISAETTARVKERAQEIGYKIHPHIQTLMSSQRRRAGTDSLEVIAFVTDVRSEKEMSEKPGAMAFYLAAKSHAEASGCILEWLPLLSDDAGGEALHQVILARGILGIILAPNFEASQTVPSWMSRFAIVAVGNYWSIAKVDRVRSDGSEAYLSLVSALDHQGCAHIGTFFPPSTKRLERGVSNTVRNLNCWGGATITKFGQSMENAESLDSRVSSLGIDGVIFHGSKNAKIAEEYSERYPGRLIFAEYRLIGLETPPRWLSACVQPGSLGRAVVNRIIEKIARSEWGYPAEPVVIVAPSEIIDPMH